MKLFNLYQATANFNYKWQTSFLEFLLRKNFLNESIEEDICYTLRVSEDMVNIMNTSNSYKEYSEKMKEYFTKEFQDTIIL